MKKFVLALSAVVFGSVAASAADLPARTVKALPPAPIYNWTGFYLGVDAGGGWEQFDGSYVIPPPDRHSSSASRFLGGGFVGGQYQVSNWVFGAEASYTGFEDSWSSSVSRSGDCLASIAGRTCTHKFKDLWDIGGKVGFAFDRWMVYGTGGYASVQLDTQTLLTGTPTVTSQSSYRHDGWFAGVGADVIVTKWGATDLILGLQYKHYEFDNVRHFAATPGLPAPVVPDANTRDINGKADVVTGRLSVKFGPAPAVFAKY